MAPNKCNREAPTFPPPDLLSRFELLPAELRLQIYTYLGFPINRTLNLQCAHDYPPDYKHFGHTSQPPCPGWQSGPLRLAGIRFMYAAGRFTEPILSKGLASEKIDVPSICGRKGCGLRPLKKVQWMEMAVSLMRVNRRISSELYELVYAGLDIQFDFQLSEYAVHKREQATGDEEVDRPWEFMHMSVSTSMMRFLTNITLSELVGIHNTSKKPNFTPAFRKRVLQRLASSITYVANHCPKLESLTILPHAGVFQGSRQSQLGGVVEALKQVAETCQSLEKLEIRVYQQKPRCGCYNEFSAKKGGHTPMKEALIRESLTWEGEMRPKLQVVAAWAEYVLWLVKNDGRLLMVCPSYSIYMALTRYFNGES